MPLRIATFVGLLAFAVTVEAAPVPKGEKTTAEKVVGRWELVKSRGAAPVQKHIIIFAKDGTMTLEVGSGDNVTKYTGKYKASEKAIDYELTMGDEKKAEKLDIKKIDDDNIKTTDPDGIEEEFKRVKEKKEN